MGENRELLRLQRTIAASTTAATASPRVGSELPVVLEAIVAIGDTAAAAAKGAAVAADHAAEGKYARGERESGSEPAASL